MQQDLEIQELARQWRDQHGYSGRGGVVVVYQGEVSGWVDRLRDPGSWQPGCVAVDEGGALGRLLLETRTAVP